MSWGWLKGSNKAPEPCIYPELKSPETEADYKEIVDEKLKLLLDLTNSDDGWNLIADGDSKFPNVKLFDREIAGSAINGVKTVTQVAVPPKDVFNVLTAMNPELSRSWEPDLLEISLHHKFNDNLMVTRAVFSTPYPITHREVVTVRAYKILEDGTHITIHVSINHPDFPVNSKFVRAAVQVSGYVSQPVPGNPNASKVTRITQLDPKGSIPAFVANMFKTQNAKGVAALRDYLEGQKK